MEFNGANTDASIIPTHVEMVMFKSAMEWLLGCGSSTREFVSAIENAFVGISDKSKRGPLAEPWLKRWPKQPRPLLAWANEFCVVRGVSAHGAGSAPTVWKEHQHLVFAALLFPLLVKLTLSRKGLLALREDDNEVLMRIDAFLGTDPFAHDWESEDRHPWCKLEADARLTSLARALYPTMVHS